MRTRKNSPETVPHYLPPPRLADEPLIFLNLDAGDVWIEAHQIVMVRRMELNGRPGNRSSVTLATVGRIVNVMESPEEIFEMLGKALGPDL